MGNEGAQWVGMEPFVDADHLFHNYGDGTYFHSAQLALQYCIGAGKHMTFKILYNDTIAMTGGQDAPYKVGVPELATILLAQGVTKVAITADDLGRYRGVDLPKGVEVHDRTDIVAVQDDLRSTPGVTVLIHDQACAAELRRARRRGKLRMPTRRIVINHRICEGCGDCGDVSNCLSVQPLDTPLGRKTTIDQASCNFDESCLQGDCPSFMTVEIDRRPARPAAAQSGPRLDIGPDPALDPSADHIRVRMAGIGGTGVVTVAQILATAALLDGWEVRGLDQTGLSQKAGPVISDVVLARPGAISSNLVGARQAEVILGFDALVAASDGAISAADPATTTVIATTHRTPDGADGGPSRSGVPASRSSRRASPRRPGPRATGSSTRPRWRPRWRAAPRRRTCCCSGSPCRTVASRCRSTRSSGPSTSTVSPSTPTWRRSTGVGAGPMTPRRSIASLPRPARATRSR